MVGVDTAASAATNTLMQHIQSILVDSPRLTACVAAAAFHRAVPSRYVIRKVDYMLTVAAVTRYTASPAC